MSIPVDRTSRSATRTIGERTYGKKRPGRASKPPLTVRASGDKPPAPPHTWADASAVRGYVAAMNDRASKLTGTATVYVSASPIMSDSRRWPSVRADIALRLPAVEQESFRSLFDRDRARYTEGWDTALDLLDGLVVCLYGSVGPGVAREIRSAISRKMPVLVYSGKRLVPLVDCRIQRHPHPSRTQVLTVTLPAATVPGGDVGRLTYRASLTALGVAS